MKSKKILVLLVIAVLSFSAFASIRGSANVQSYHNHSTPVSTLFSYPNSTSYRPYKRLTFVYSDPVSYLDEYAFLASIPANVFRDEDENFYAAPIVYGESAAGNYLIEDWKAYCDEWGGVNYVDFVGPYGSDYISNMKNYLGTDKYTCIVADDPYEYAAAIALRDWTNSSAAVIAPATTYFAAPEALHGEFHGEFFNVTEEYTVQYDFGPGVIHRNKWLNFTIPANITGAMVARVQLLNWTTAVGEAWLTCFLIDPEGQVVDYDFTPAEGDYNWTMWDINERPTTTTENYTVAIRCLGFEGGNYSLTLDGYVYGFSGKQGNLDVYTITVPENARELDAWLSCNSTGQEMSWVSMWLIDPEGRVLFPNYFESEYTEYPPSPLYVSDIGHLNTLHPTPGNWTLIAGAELLGDYPPNQTVEYTVQYRIASYNEDKLDYVEAAANGAVIASLLNDPLLFTTTNTLPQETRETLQILGVEEVIIVDPAGIISGTVKSQITGMGIMIAQDLLSLGNIVSYIQGLSGETDLVLTVPTDNFFAPAALAGAFHGAPILTFKGNAKEIPTLADSTWASQYYHEIYGYGLDWLLKAPPIHWMHELSEIWSQWIGGLGADAEGLESVLTVAPLVDVKPVFERAIAGIAKAGRIPGENAEEDVAFVNRAMLYPAIIHANPGYDIAMPTCVSYDYGIPDIPSDGWNTTLYPDFMNRTNLMVNQTYVYPVNGWENTTEAMRNRNFTVEAHVGKYEVFDTLNSGVAFWYHSNHGGLGFVWDYLPFGQGGVGLWYKDPPDPQPKRGYEYNATTYAEDASVPDQYDLAGDPYPDGAVYQKLDEPFSNAYGGEFDRWLGNIHSVSVVFMDCYVGGSLLPLTMMRHGAVSAIGDMITGYLIDTDWFCVKYTQEVMAGKTLGEAFVTAVTKAGYVYPNTYFNMTLFSPAKVPDVPWTVYPYVDDCCNAFVLYGDPDVIIVNMTAQIPEALNPKEISVMGHDPDHAGHAIPVAEIREPTAQEYLKGNCNIVIYGYDSNLDVLLLYIGENMVNTWNVSGTHTYTWDTTTQNDGSYMIKLLANNTAGNSVEKTVTVTVDNTAPSVNITSPGAGAQLTGTTTIEFEASDPNLDLAQLIIDESVFMVTGKTSYEWNTTTVGEGTRTIKLLAYDKAGNKAETHPITVTVANLQEIIEESYEAGREEGYVEGYEEGHKAGEEEGYASGINLGMAIGVLTGLAITAIIAYAITKRHSRRSPQTRP